jgi:hypothetical protein
VSSICEKSSTGRFPHVFVAFGYAIDSELELELELELYDELRDVESQYAKGPL